MGMPKYTGKRDFVDFKVYEASKDYLKNEKTPVNSWKGPAPETIHSKLPQQPPAPLDKIFGDFFKHLWVRAEQPIGPARGNFLAQTRQPQPGTPSTAPYQRIPSPTVPVPKAVNPLPAFPKLPANPPAPMPGRLPPPPPPPRPVNPAAIHPNFTPHLQGIAQDWDLHRKLERFTGYTFRGDRRDPWKIFQAGGFKPSSTRDDNDFIKNAVYDQFCAYMIRRFQKDLRHIDREDFLKIVQKVATTPSDREVFHFYAGWRELAKGEEQHIGRMVANETFKAYISTTRAIDVAKAFGKSGWVYCVLVNGGFVVPDPGKHEWTKLFGESEIAVPNGLPWENVVAFRATDAYGKFDIHSHLYIREGLDRKEPKAFETISKLMSGKNQEAKKT
jgi:hypothetical protein